jgi:hypothetical protein
MGVSVHVEWPGCSEDESALHPGFENDDHFWANWVLNALGNPRAAATLRKLGVDTLLRHNTSGLDPGDVGWAKPSEFESAALKLADLVSAEDSAVKPLLEIYRVEWDRIIGEDERGVGEWFAQDLWDVAAVARYAAECGAKTMTLGYYW